MQLPIVLPKAGLVGIFETKEQFIALLKKAKKRFAIGYERV
ncbi:MAG: hypothetical protein ACRDBG_04590 [Waterburya sp.]